MKAVLYLGCVYGLLGFLPAMAQTDNNTPARSCEITEKFEGINLPEFITKETFNANGQLLTSKRQSVNGSVNNAGYFYAYNDRGLLEKDSLMTVNGKRTTYTYDAMGRVLRAAEYENRQISDFTTTYYDGIDTLPQSRITRTIQGEVVGKWEFEYTYSEGSGEDRYLIKRLNWYQGTSTTRVCRIKHLNKQGQVIKKEVLFYYDSDEPDPYKSVREEIKYDAQGRKIASTTMKLNGDLERRDTWSYTGNSNRYSTYVNSGSSFKTIKTRTCTTIKN